MVNRNNLFGFKFNLEIYLCFYKIVFFNIFFYILLVNCVFIFVILVIVWNIEEDNLWIIVNFICCIVWYMYKSWGVFWLILVVLILKVNFNFY